MKPSPKLILDRVHPTNPFAGFPVADFPLDLQGGAEHPLLMQLIRTIRPGTIVEVGCWKGANAIRMAKLQRELGIDGAVICVDTWLGSVEHWTGVVKEWDIRPLLAHGYPTLYQQFLTNVIHSGVQESIVPVPNTSSNAAKLLAHHKLQAELIYIDGSHEEEDVYRDLCDYRPLVRPGGFLCGDDWNAYWHGVISGVKRFAKEHRLSVQISGPMWCIQMPTRIEPNERQSPPEPPADKIHADPLGPTKEATQHG